MSNKGDKVNQGDVPQSEDSEAHDFEDEVTQSLPAEVLKGEGQQAASRGTALADAREGSQAASRGTALADAREGSHDLSQRIKEMEDKYLRTYADFENYRRRMAREREDLVLHTGEKILKGLLEVKDHLESALEHGHETPETKGLREGVELTLKQLNKFLEKNDVTEIQSLGEIFDPAYHEAIHQEESAEYKPGTVVHVYQKGYLFHKRLLRAARVIVAAAKK